MEKHTVWEIEYYWDAYERCDASELWDDGCYHCYLERDELAWTRWADTYLVIIPPDITKRIRMSMR